VFKSEVIDAVREEVKAGQSPEWVGWVENLFWWAVGAVTDPVGKFVRRKWRETNGLKGVWAGVVGGCGWVVGRVKAFCGACEQNVIPY
jgi:hypothetical protein